MLTTVLLLCLLADYIEECIAKVAWMDTLEGTDKYIDGGNNFIQMTRLGSGPDYRNPTG